MQKTYLISLYKDILGEECFRTFEITCDSASFANFVASTVAEKCEEIMGKPIFHSTDEKL